MKYLPTLNVWDVAIQGAILSGQIKLQVGQWLRCGTTGKRSRYVASNERSINIVHWQGSGKASSDLFMARINAFKSNGGRCVN